MKYEEFNLSKNSDGLLPVVVQDCETLKVLMVAYMNKEAYEKTCETGKATFYSRTRSALWTSLRTAAVFAPMITPETSALPLRPMISINADLVPLPSSRVTTLMFLFSSNSPPPQEVSVPRVQSVSADVSMSAKIFFMFKISFSCFALLLYRK